MEYFTILVTSGESNFGAWSPDVLGCVAVGHTIQETLDEMKSALSFHFEGILEDGEELPQPKGLSRHLETGEYVPEPGDFLTFFAAEPLLTEATIAAQSHSQTGATSQTVPV